MAPAAAGALLISAVAPLAAAQVTPAPAPPVSQHLFLHGQRVVNIGLVDYGHHALDPVLKGLIANSFDSLVSGDQQLDFAFFHQENPELEIYSYFNSILLALDQPAPVAEKAYLHDGSVPEALHGPSNRLGKLFEGDFYYVMDPGSAEWQEHSRLQVQATLNNGFDGVLIDDVFAHLMHEAHFGPGEPLLIGTPSSYVSFATVPFWYDAQQSHDASSAYLNFLSQKVSGLVVYNGINDHAEAGAPIAPSLHPGNFELVCDGSIQEGFVYNGKWVAKPADGLVGDAFWEAGVQVLKNRPPGKRHSVVSYGDVNNWRARVYSLASFLIGHEPGTEASFYYAPDEFTLTSLPEWYLDLGSTLEVHPTLAEYMLPGHQVFARSFQNGIVLVNPYGTATASIPLGGEYYEVSPKGKIKTRNGVALGSPQNLSFHAVTSVQLPGYSAIILMRP